jgi:hypothetical protein
MKMGFIHFVQIIFMEIALLIASISIKNLENMNQIFLLAIFIKKMRRKSKDCFL